MNIKLFFSDICCNQTGAGAVSAKPGLDFELLLESISAGLSLGDFDTVGRALVTGITFGLQLGMTGDVSDWPLHSTFKRD